MTRDEALQVFDEIVSEQIGEDQRMITARCCGLPVVMNSQGGIARIYCSKCGRIIEELGRQWVVSDWGRRGIKLPGASRPIDGKFRIEGEKIVNPGGVEIPRDEPLFLLRARDRNALPALAAYAGACQQDGCNEYQMAGIGEAISKFAAFASVNPERMKQPGVTRGK